MTKSYEERVSSYRRTFGPEGPGQAQAQQQSTRSEHVSYRSVPSINQVANALQNKHKPGYSALPISSAHQWAVDALLQLALPVPDEFSDHMSGQNPLALLDEVDQTVVIIINFKF